MRKIKDPFKVTKMGVPTLKEFYQELRKGVPMKASIPLFSIPSHNTLSWVRASKHPPP